MDELCNEWYWEIITPILFSITVVIVGSIGEKAKQYKQAKIEKRLYSANLNKRVQEMNKKDELRRIEWLSQSGNY